MFRIKISPRFSEYRRAFYRCSTKVVVTSIVNEAIGTIHLFIYFYKDNLLKTHKLCSNILICLKSIIKHTSNFHLDITPRSIKKTNNFSFKYFYMLEKAHKQLSFRYYVQKHKKQTIFCLEIVGTRCNK